MATIFPLLFLMRGHLRVSTFCAKLKFVFSVAAPCTASAPKPTNVRNWLEVAGAVVSPLAICWATVGARPSEPVAGEKLVLIGTPRIDCQLMLGGVLLL